MDKLKIWQPERSWEESEAAWDAGIAPASRERPLKTLKTLPSMVGITPGTAKGLRWKALWYLLARDEGRAIFRGVLKHPFRYLKEYIKSLRALKRYTRDGDFFLYGTNTVAEFEQHLADPEAIFLLGFSYCHKPFECPSGRFTSECIHDAAHAVCRQCFIGKAVHATPEQNSVIVFIPTVHYIGAKVFELLDRFPNKPILFLITACELTLEMFADWGNMVKIQGIGVRLDGRICNTMKAFELSERGVKPGLTVVLDETQRRILELLRKRRNSSIE